LEVSNSFGNDIATQVSYINVEGAPTSGFSSTLNVLTTNFSNTSTGANSYAWDFGDGNTSTATNPIHTYATGGIYTVILVATNDCGSTTFTDHISFASLPVAAFDSDITSGCGPLEIQFNDNSTGNATDWNWSFPGGTPATSTDQNPTITYSTPGTYNVTLVAANSSGNNTSTQTAYIEVLNEATSSFTSMTNSLNAMFTNTSTNATSFSWDFGDGNTNTGSDPNHIYTTDGTYTVTMIATGPCGSITSTQEVTVTSLPVAGFISNVTNGCAPLSVQFTDQSSANTSSWAWSFPGGTPSSSTDQNPVITFAAAGNYDVTLLATNTAGNSTQTQSAYIAVATTADVSFGINVSSLTATFDNTSSNGISYLWDFGDGNTSTDENPTHEYAANGTYIVTLTVANACGSVSTTETIEVQYSGSAPTANFSADVTTGCSPITVEFTDLSSTDATTWAWNFPGGSPSTSTDQNPTVTYANPGMYDVVLVVSNPGGSNTVSQTSLIEVTAQPLASFNSGVNGNAISLTNTSTGATSYAWNFGDGSMSTDENPTHNYAMDGTYTVTLTATNACGTTTTTETVTVITAATVAFTADILSGCTPLTVNFTDQSTGTVDSWLWEITGATPSSSTNQNPTFTFDTPGTYDVTLTATNASGDYTNTQTSYIVVASTPTVDFDVNFSGGVYSFTNNTTGATSYSWDFGDGNMSTDMNPTHTYTTDGTFVTTLTASNDCGSVTTTQTITVTSVPVVAFTADILSGCAPLVVNFMDLTTGTVDSWSWEITGGTPNTSTEQNPIATFDTPGTYDVTLTVTNLNGSYPITQTSMIVVEAAPTAAFDANLSGSVYSFTNNSTASSSFVWDFGDGSMTSTEMNPTHAYAMSGSYTVQLISNGSCGADTTELLLGVVAAPMAAFSSDTVFGCAPFMVQFTDESANAIAWNWTFDGGTPSTSTDQNPLITYDTPGTYAVTLDASNSVGSDNITVNSYIVVDDVPTASFSANSDTTHVTFLNTSMGGTNPTYLWDFGDGMTSTDVTPSHDYPAGGTYIVSLTVTNDCGTETFEMTIVLTTATNEITFLEEFLLFPNPSDGQFTIVLKGEPKDDLHINLINIIGQYIHQEEVDFTSGQLNKTFNFDRLPVGTYIIELKSNQQVSYKKVVIE